jgi:transposase-like protein
MADTGSLGVRAELGKVLQSEHADLLREGVALILAEVMELEVARLAGGEHYERSEQRAAYRNGYRPRRLDTRVGTLELEIPKLRSGPSYLPSFLEARKRSEQALLSVVMQAYVEGVSTRKVERLVEQLGVEGISKSSVSRICKGLDGRSRAPIPTSGSTRASSGCARPTPTPCATRRSWSPTASTPAVGAR